LFMTREEVEPFLRVYEGLIKPKMHNFFDPFDESAKDLDHFVHYTNLNRRFVEKVLEVR